MSEWFIISSQKATAVRTLIGPGSILAKRLGHAIDPKKIEAGEHAGKYAIATRNFTNKQFEAIKDRFESVVIAELVNEEAWPPVVES